MADIRTSTELIMAEAAEFHSQALSQNCGKQVLASSCLSVYPSA
jgi:hypothetical protein